MSKPPLEEGDLRPPRLCTQHPSCKGSLPPRHPLAGCPPATSPHPTGPDPALPTAAGILPAGLAEAGLSLLIFFFSSPLSISSFDI